MLPFIVFGNERTFDLFKERPPHHGGDSVIGNEVGKRVPESDVVLHQGTVSGVRRQPALDTCTIALEQLNAKCANRLQTLTSIIKNEIDITLTVLLLYSFQSTQHKERPIQTWSRNRCGSRCLSAEVLMRCFVSASDNTACSTASGFLMRAWLVSPPPFDGTVDADAEN